MKAVRLLIRSIIVILSGIAGSGAAVPQIISYQGSITVSGSRFTGSGQFKFALVNGAGTVTYWSNDDTSSAGGAPVAAVAVPVREGVFSVLLGDTTLANMTALPANVFANPEVWLRIWFNDGIHGFEQLTPDQRIVSVGYAMRSEEASLASAVADNAVTTAKLADGAVTAAKLQNSSLTFNAGAGLSGGGSVALGGSIGLAANLIHNSSLSGNGGSTALGLNLANANTWSGVQTFSSTIQGDISGTAAGFRGSLAGDVTGLQGATTINNLSATKILGGDLRAERLKVGLYHTLSGTTATIAGGQANEASGYSAAVSGGYDNTASGEGSSVGGGRLNYATNSWATVGGGYANQSGGNNATVPGGFGNVALGASSFAAGDHDRAWANYATIPGGQYNTVQLNANYTVIGGGTLNVVYSNSMQGVIAGGKGNWLFASNSVISGGISNSIGQLGRFDVAEAVVHSSIGGGFGNSIGVGYSFDPNAGCTISGGVMNEIQSVYAEFPSPYATISGGNNNWIDESSEGAVIAGGSRNRLWGLYSVIGGGYGNYVISTDCAVIAGGALNYVLAYDYSSIGGGYANTNYGDYSVIGGGKSNLTAMDYSVIPGGLQAKTANYGQLAHASGSFAAQGDAQTSVYVCRNRSTSTTPVVLFLDGNSQRLYVPSGASWSFEGTVVGRSSAGATMGYRFQGTIENVGGVTQLIGVPLVETLGEELAACSLAVTADDTTDSLSIVATGVAGTTIRWVASVRTVEVSY